MKVLSALLSFFLVSLSLSLSLSFPVNASASIRLNHESVRARIFTANLIDTLTAVRETLMVANSVFPVKVSALDEGDEFYKNLLSRRSSGEAFRMFLDFMTEDENSGISIALKNLFTDEEGEIFETNGVSFYVRWLWLELNSTGLVCVPQEKMSREIFDRIWNSRLMFHIFEIHYSLPDERTLNSPFFKRGMEIILGKFPSAYVSNIERSPEIFELVHMIFPDVTGIPEVIRRTLGFN